MRRNSSATRRCSSCSTGSARARRSLIEDLVPKLLPMSVVVKVLQILLLERVPIRNLRTICETLAELAPKTQDPAVLRRRGARRARPQHRAGHRRPARGAAGHHPRSRARAGPAGFDGRAATTAPGFEPGLADRIQQSLADSTRRQEAAGEPAGAAGRAEDPAVGGAPHAPFDARSCRCSPTTRFRRTAESA